MTEVCVLGAGAWGTALALAALRAGCDVTLLARTSAQAEAIDSIRRVPKLGSIELPAELRVAAVGGKVAADLVILAVPMQASADGARSLQDLLPPGIPVVGAAKGIEQDSGRFLSEIIAVELPDSQPAIISGPGFAGEVAAGLPTALTVAAMDEALAADLAKTLSSPEFRLYSTGDVRGVEIGGAAKNVLAIASGIAAGRGLGASANAALVARGFAELSRFARALGAQAETLMGLSGLGDLVLTATSAKSRNFALGEALGQGVPLTEALARGLAEGVATAGIMVELAERAGVSMPIATSVAAIVSGAVDVDTALKELLARPLKAEGE